ncbi:MAG: hypothetical protein HY711_03330 [Candidatus Melainabacteria bacterium]|nr:hypothetical protein [Candidatus Melainabacteria bacterium]
MHQNLAGIFHEAVTMIFKTVNQSKLLRHSLAVFFCFQVLLYQTLCFAPPAEAVQGGSIAYTTSLSPQTLEEVTAEIVQKEIELLRLNTYFRIESTDRGRLKPWRLFLYNLGGSGVSNAGITTVAAERWRTWQRPKTANRNALKAGPMLLMIGHSIVVGGILIEATLDVINDHKVKKKGFNAKAAKARALKLKNEIDAKIAERERLLVEGIELSDRDKEVARVEGKVLKDVRDLGLIEHSQFYVRAKRRRAARDVGYINGFAAATTGGYIGSLMGLLAVSNRKPRLAGPAGIGFILSGAHIVMAPVVGKVSANIAGKHASKQIKGELGAIAPKVAESFDADRQELQRLVQTMVPGEYSSKLLDRLAVYEGADEIFENQAKMNKGEKQKADKEFKERFLWNAAVGGTKMGWGIQLANAGFGYQVRPAMPTVRVPLQFGGATARVALPNPKGANELFSRRVAQGATTYLPGTGIWILDTLQARARGEMELYNMGSQMALPQQKLKNRLNKLDSLEALLKKSPAS